MKYIDPNLLNTFITLVNCKQFTLAGGHLGLSQSAVSQQIQKLETLVNTTLIKRNKRHVSLTSQGQSFYTKAKALLEHHESLIYEFNHTELSGYIRFGSPEDFATQYLPSILSQFVKRHPNVQIEVHCEFTLNLLEKFDHGEYDIVVVKREPDTTRKKKTRLWQEPLVWVAAESYDIEQALDAKNIRLVLAPSPCVYRTRAIDALEANGLRWEQTYTSPSLAGAVAAVRGGMGVTVLPLTSVPDDLLTNRHKQCELYRLPVLKDTAIHLLSSGKPNTPVAVFEAFIGEALSETHH